MYLAIDLGSTFFKAAVFSPDMRCAGRSEHCMKYSSMNAKVEIEPGEVAAAFDQVIEGSLSAAGVSASKIRAIGLTSQAQTFCVMDKHGGFKTPFISWRDMRACENGDMLSADGRLKDFAEHSSFPKLFPNLQISVLHFLRGVVTPDSVVMPLPSFLTWLLTDEMITDSNIAGMSGLYSIKDMGWWRPGLELCGLVPSQLPGAGEAGKASALVCGHASEKYGFRKNTPVFSCGNDQTAGAYGAGLHLNENDVLLTLGSAMVLYKCTDSLPRPSVAYARGPYPSGKFYRFAAAEGGTLVNVAIKKHPEIDSLGTFFSLAEKASAENMKVIKLIFDENNNEINWMESGTAAQYAYSVLAYTAEKTKSLFESLEIDRSSSCKILCCGGGSKSRLWVELVEKELDTALEVIDKSPLDGVAYMLEDILKKR